MIQQMKGRESSVRNIGSRALKAEEVFMNWSRKIGVNGNCVASLALHALRFRREKLTVLPLRVALATSFWIGLRFCGDRSAATFQNLRRVEEISGVPGKLIVATEAKLVHALRQRRARRELKEGWAEC
ncbi:hypothetical protein L6164_021710 [Bauhinia variegata]|nr:hypothetical protein L6164_021710 [Bauhinia variegata]